MIQIWYIFAAWANLQHFYQFNQIYILGKNDSFHFTSNAGKNIAKSLICSGVCSCFSRIPKEHFCMWLTLICLKSKNNKFLDIWLYHKFAHLHHNYPYNCKGSKYSELHNIFWQSKVMCMWHFLYCLFVLWLKWIFNLNCNITLLQ